MKTHIVFFLFIYNVILCCSQTNEIVHLKDVDIYYESYGEGSPLVLLHGFTQTHADWYHLIDSLSSHYQLIIPDLRGHGQSTNPAHKFTCKQSAIDIYSLLDHLDINKFKAIGYSAGGLTLLHMALMDTSRLEAMVLIGTAPYFPKSSRNVLKDYTYETLNKATRDYYLKIHPRGEKQVRELLHQLNGFSESYNDINFTAPMLSTIRTKTLIIQGDRDILFPVETALELYRSIPNAYLWIAPNYGHDLISASPVWHTPFINILNNFFYKPH
ncbi:MULTISPECIES: alpha/beta fold hydrolase [unclassified Carboxylicivirga]|uniref:alpha/beta fold hydrolase n=1 Tax=Carboxylicivirga TaxID=1628153 RepID=UPI003D347528